jgi:hypothetical protein
MAGLSNQRLEIMESNSIEVRAHGKTLQASSARIEDRTVITTGKWIKMAAVMDEELVEGELVRDPESFAAELKQARLNADIFTFAQRPPEVAPKYDYHFEWDNWAVIPITCFKDWWDGRLPQEARKNVRRATKRGVIVKTVAFDDDLVRGIQEIYNETPVRQGRKFWHYGKDFATVKLENATYLDRSEFIGAYVGTELAGFIKIIYAGPFAALIQIIAKNAHHDKRPMNAMLAKAVELCEAHGASYLVYGKYIYDGREDSPLTEFKRRNGFEEIKFPRYFVPLTTKGRLAIKLGLHLGIRNVIPAPVVSWGLNLRSRYYRRRNPAGQVTSTTSDAVESERQS